MEATLADLGPLAIFRPTPSVKYLLGVVRLIHCIVLPTTSLQQHMQCIVTRCCSTLFPSRFGPSAGSPTDRLLQRKWVTTLSLLKTHAFHSNTVRILEYRSKPRTSTHSQSHNVGPTNCIGRSVAWRELRFVLTSLVYHFDFELPNDFNRETWLNGQGDYGLLAVLPLPFIVTRRKHE
jgi:hypothetical protein